MVTEQASNRPYAPAATVIAMLQRLRSRNLPERIDKDYLLDSGVTDGIAPRTLSALKFLNLINDAYEPTRELRDLHTSTDEEYRQILSGLIRTAYSEIFEVVEPAQDTQDKIFNAFRRYAPASQRMRMVTFFLGMCREAGIPTLDVPRARPTIGERKERRKVEPQPKSQLGRPREKKAGGEESTVTIGIPPALEGLVRSLPPPGTSMSRTRREQWLNMAEATLQFMYPVEEVKEESAEEVEPEDLPF